MSADEVSQIKVGRHRMGIIGLKAALEEVARDMGAASEEQITAELIQRLSRRNYIPSAVEADYGRAFLREYKKFVGMPPAEEKGGMLEIKVLTSACPCSGQIEQELMAALAALDLEADIQQVADIREFGSYGVSSAPALIISDKVVWVGSVPPRAKIKKWLLEAASKKA